MKFIKRLFRSKLFIAVLVIAAAWGGYAIYKKATTPASTTRYLTEAAAKGSISVSVSGTGQVASTNQVDVKPQVSGTILSIPVKLGQGVTAGQLIASLDSTSAQKSVRDAQVSLDSAKLSLEKLQEAADPLSLLQAQNALAQAQSNKLDAQNALAKAYDDGYTAVTNAFLDLPTIMTGLQDVIMGNEANLNQGNLDFYADSAKVYDSRADQYRTDALNAYYAARDAYNKNFTDFKNTDRTSDNATITSIIAETYATANSISEAVKDVNNAVQFYNDVLTEKNLKPVALASTQLTTLNGFTSKITGHVSDLLSAQQAITNNQTDIVNADQSIAEKQASLAKLQAGPDPLDVKSSQLSVEQRQNALSDAQQQLAYYSVRAPFTGTVAALPANVGDQASSGTTIATIIANQQVADVTLNEVDIAKVKVGEKATLAFDAIDGLTITGKVSSIDLIGTVSQGVVSYNVKIVFDTQDSRVKSGMSVAAAIINAFKADIVTVPNTAVKTQGGQSYVLVMKNGQPVRTDVTTGLANDTDTEIVSGVNEGDEVVTQTITASSAPTANTNARSTGIPGLGGGAIRINGGGGFGGR